MLIPILECVLLRLTVSRLPYNSPPRFFPSPKPRREFTGKLRVGDDLSIAVILQSARADVKPFANLLACKEMFTTEEWPVRLGYFPNPFPDASQGGEDYLHFARLHTQVLNCFHHRIVVFAVLSDFTQSNCSTSSRL